MKEYDMQQERLEFLVEAFKEDSGQYQDLKTPESAEEKRVLLRSLMNIRMPGKLPAKVLSVQDSYLQRRNSEKGIVTVDEIPLAEEGISVWQGDITRLEADAIVNAANSQMLGCFVPMHTCIDNCIHTYAGVQLRQECAEKMAELKKRYGEDYEQPTSVPLLTKGYNLPAKNVIHVAGPIVEYRLTERHEKELADCYRNVLDMCKDNGLRSVAFCCISTGVFRFPNERAAEVAVKTVREWREANPGAADRVIFNVFKDTDRRYYEQELGKE